VASKKTVPSEEEVKAVLPNQPQNTRQSPLQGNRRLNMARMQNGLTSPSQRMSMNNLMGLAARKSPYSAGS
jgi:hypothetical protein